MENSEITQPQTHHLVSEMFDGYSSEAHFTPPNSEDEEVGSGDHLNPNCEFLEQPPSNPART